MIIGITGTLGAGKGAIVDYLLWRGFKHYSVRDFLTAEIVARGLEVNRENMVFVGNDLRERNGAGFIVSELYARAQAVGGKCVIESIRNPGEIEALRAKGDFVLFAVNADVKMRYERIVTRGSSTDNISFEDFVAQEKREASSADPNKQNLNACIERADYFFENNGSVEELYAKVEAVLAKFDKIDGEEYVRPSWDEYFMEISRMVAKRATCNRGRSGCVIAKDKQILVTGYVGSPKGLPHCDDVGHQFQEVIHPDMTRRMHCVRTAHAEQNAICQAAKLGIPVDGSTLYCNMTPCFVCAKMIINSGIVRVVCSKKYHAGSQSEDMFKTAGVALEILDDEVETYKDM